MKNKKNILWAGWLVWLFTLPESGLAEQVPELPADFITIMRVQHYYPQSIVDIDGVAFFAAETVTHGIELWKTDGTSAGTVLVKDIRPGGEVSFPSNLTNVKGSLFFFAFDGVHGDELWKSDGT